MIEIFKNDSFVCVMIEDENSKYKIFLAEKKQDIEAHISFEDQIKLDQINKEQYEGFVKSNLKNFEKYEAIALLGIIRFEQGQQIVYVPNTKNSIDIVGSYLDDKVYKINTLRLIRLFPKKQVDSQEKEYKSLFLNNPFSGQLYQTLNENISQSQQNSINNWIDYNTPNPYLFNSFLLQNIPKQIDKQFVKVIFGYFEEKNFKWNGNSYCLKLISRQNVNQAGTRYKKRGLSRGSHAAHSVETEQVIKFYFNGKYYCYSQVFLRGSVPIRFRQEVSAMNPKPLIEFYNDDILSEKSFVQFTDLVKKQRGKIQCVDLLCRETKHKTNSEDVLSNSQENVCHDYNNLIKDKKIWNEDLIDQIQIDVKTELDISKINFIKKQSNLIHAMLESKDMFYFESQNANDTKKRNSKKESIQKGVIRFNCLDCLDRTNAIMKMVALDFALHIFELNNMRAREENNVVKIIGDDLDEMWMNNGDFLALHQGGSKALRQKDLFDSEGMLNKVHHFFEKKFNEFVRFQTSSMKDSQKQNCQDLFLGVFKPFQRSVLDKEIWDVDNDMQLHWEERKSFDFNLQIGTEVRSGMNYVFKSTQDKSMYKSLHSSRNFEILDKFQIQEFNKILFHRNFTQSNIEDDNVQKLNPQKDIKLTQKEWQAMENESSVNRTKSKSDGYLTNLFNFKTVKKSSFKEESMEHDEVADIQVVNHLDTQMAKFQEAVGETDQLSLDSIQKEIEDFQDDNQWEKEFERAEAAVDNDVQQDIDRVNINNV